ncbi:hypothetical protein HDC90_004884 [Pedobacter sp. AK013]|nr:hypothetical protein [Pedobacter sp. AK013]
MFLHTLYGKENIVKTLNFNSNHIRHISLHISAIANMFLHTLYGKENIVKTLTIKTQSAFLSA